MYAKTTIFVTLLLAIAVCGAKIRPTSRQGTAAFRRECRLTGPPLICNLSPTSGSSVSGSLTFRPVVRVFDGEARCVVRIRGVIDGLTQRFHGMHIHQYGDISAPDGLSTGPHFLNPQGTPVLHGLPNDAVRHWGDFGNLRANSDGRALYNRIDSVISIPGIIGRGITVHAGRDQGSDEQPTGASGPRIGVCVIGIANPSNI